MSVRTAGGCLLLLGEIGHQRLRGQDHGRDGGRVLEGRTGHLGRVDDARREHVPVLALEGVKAGAELGLGNGLHDDLAARAGIVGDLADRSFESAADDVHPDLLLAIELELVESRDGLQQRRATTGDDPLLDGRAGRR